MNKLRNRLKNKILIFITKIIKCQNLRLRNEKISLYIYKNIKKPK